MKLLKYTIPAILIGLFISGSVWAVTVFNSNQVGSSPSNGKILQTNGSSSTWVATSTLGISGIANISPLIANGTVAGVNATSSTVSFNVQGTTTLNPFNVSSSSGTSQLIVTAGGKVGIGTSTPTNNLTIIQTTTGNDATGLLIDGTANAANADINLNRGNTTTSESNIDFNTLGVEQWQMGLQNNTSNDFELWDGSDNPAFTINHTTLDAAFGTTTASSEVTIQNEPGGASSFNVLDSAGAPSFLINNGDLVGIGTITPRSVLFVQATSSKNTLPLFSVATFTGTSLFQINSNGNVNIATLTAGSILISDANKNVANSSLSQSAGTTFINGVTPIIDGGGDWLNNVIQTSGANFIVQAPTSTAVLGNVVFGGGVQQFNASTQLTPTQFCTGGLFYASSSTAFTITLPTLSQIGFGITPSACTTSIYSGNWSPQYLTNAGTAAVTSATSGTGETLLYPAGSGPITYPGMSAFAVGQFIASSTQVGATTTGTSLNAYLSSFQPTSTQPTTMGQILSADATGHGWQLTNLVAGSNMTIATNTAGQITFTATAGGSGCTVPGADTQILFNNGGACGASSNFKFSSTTGLTVLLPSVLASTTITQLALGTSNNTNNLLTITPQTTYSASTQTGGAVNIDNSLNGREALVVYQGTNAIRNGGNGQVRIQNASTTYTSGELYITSTSTSGADFDLRIDSPNPDIEMYEFGNASPNSAYEIAIPTNEDVLQFNSRNAGNSAFENMFKFQSVKLGGRACLGCLTNTLTGGLFNIVDASTTQDALDIGTTANGTNIFSVSQAGNTTIAGTVTLTSTPTSTITTSGTALNLQQTGDTFGTTGLSLQNRNGLNGALFSNAGLDLVDFGFLPNSGVQNNIRLEHRSGSLIASNNTRGEFQFFDPVLGGANGTAYLVTGASTTVINSGKLGVGTSTPANALSVIGSISSSALTSGNCVQAGAGGVLTTVGSACGSGGSGNSAWTLANGFIYPATTTEQVLIGASATTTTNKLEVIGNGYFSGNIGIGSTTPAFPLVIKSTATNTPTFQILGTNGQPTFEIRDGGSFGATLVGNTYVGVRAGSTASSTAVGNAAFGYQAMQNNTASWNTAFGNNALVTNASGTFDTAIGDGALKVNLSSWNTGVGEEALSHNTTGQTNTAVGNDTLQQNTTGRWNTAMGAYSLNAKVVGDFNTSIGEEAMFNITSSTANTVLGAVAGFNMSSSTGNTLLGYQAGDKLTTGSYNIMLGYNAGFSETTNSNKLYIANNPVWPLLFGDMANGYLNINATNTAANLYVQGTTTQPTIPIFAVASTSGTSVFSIAGSGDITIQGITTSTTALLMKNPSGQTTLQVDQTALFPQVNIGTTTTQNIASLYVIGTSASTTAPLFSLASSTKTALMTVQSTGHVVYGGTSPTMGTCGSSPGVVGNDTVGTIAVGSGVVTSCTLNFASPYKDVRCFESDNSTAVTGDVSATSTTSVTFSFSATLGGGVVQYYCADGTP